jgi:hypothetical protein
VPRGRHRWHGDHGTEFCAAEPDDIIVIVPGIYDPDLAKHIEAARAVHVSVAVAGSEIETTAP